MGFKVVERIPNEDVLDKQKRVFKVSTQILVL